MFSLCAVRIYRFVLRKSDIMFEYRAQGTNCDRTADWCKKSVGKHGVFILCKATCDWLIIKMN